MRRRIAASAIGCLSLLLAIMALAACGSGDDGAEAAGNAREDDMTIYFVGVTSPQDPFHGIVARGAEQAGKDLGVTVRYIFPDRLSVATYNQKIEEALAAKPEGIVILGLDERASEPLARRAREEGVVLAFNPAPSLRERPLWTPDDLYTSRVGSDEYSAGQVAGEQLVRGGVRGTVACPVFMPGDPTLSLRCEGAKDALEENGITTDVFPVDQDPGRASGQLTAYLREHADVGGVISLGGAIHPSVREAIERSGNPDVLEGAFDLDPATLASIRSGDTLFTIDQQPFWRGYIPVLEIVHNRRYGLQQANYFLSGPSIVDRSNVEKVADLAKEGLR